MVSNRSQLPKLRQKSEFDNLSKSGRRIHVTSWLMFSVLENDMGHLRCGWTIPKYVGTAVTRNRIRRWCREYFSLARKQAWDPSLDLNVVIRRSEKDFFKQLTFDEFRRCLDKGVRKIHVRK